MNIVNNSSYIHSSFKILENQLNLHWFWVCLKKLLKYSYADILLINLKLHCNIYIILFIFILYKTKYWHACMCMCAYLWYWNGANWKLGVKDTELASSISVGIPMFLLWHLWRTQWNWWITAIVPCICRKNAKYLGYIVAIQNSM